MLTITDNAPGSPHTVALLGTGQDFSLGAASGSSTSAIVAAGTTATYNLSITPGGGLAGTVSFACAGAPSEATCSVLPTSVTLNGSSAASAKVTVTTTARTMTSPRGPLGPPLSRLRGLPLLVWLIALLMMSAGVAAMARRWPQGLKPIPLLALTATLLLALVGCGGGGSTVVHNPGTPMGTYSLTVTATYASGSISVKHDLKLALTVE